MPEGRRDWLKRCIMSGKMENLDDKSVLELIMYYSMANKAIGEETQLLLDRFGSISEVLEAPVSELVKVKGVSEHTAILLNMLPQLCRIYTKDKASKSKIQGLSEIAKFASDCFIGRTDEYFILICLDKNLTVRSHHVISKGSVDSSSVDLRKIIEILVSSHAYAAVVSHNHPRGNSIPSQSDLHTTITIAKALKPLGISLLDHVVVGVADYTSMAQKPREYGMWLNPD